MTDEKLTKNKHNKIENNLVTAKQKRKEWLSEE